MADRLELCIMTAEDMPGTAIALTRDPGFLPGLDVIALPAGLDVDRVNAALADCPPGDGTPVVALHDLPAVGAAAGTLGMVQDSGDGARTVLVGDTAVPWDASAFAPAHAILYLHLQRYRRRFRHVVAVSGPSADLRYLSVAARAATARVTVIGTPDQIFRMTGPRDSAGVPVSREVDRVLAAAGHSAVRVLDAAGRRLAERRLA